MADQRLTDEEFLLRQKARQRLIGAVTLMMAAVVVLPWALDGKPRTHANEIAVYLPASGGASSGSAAAPALPSAAPASLPAPPPADAPVTAVPSAPSAPPAIPAPAAVPAKPVVSAAPTVSEAEAPAPAAAVQRAVKPAARPAKAAASSQDDVAPPPAASTEPAPAAAAPVDRPAATDRPTVSGYVLQVGTFSQADNARQLKARLAAKGVPAFTERLASPSGDRTRVRVGPYPSRAAAEQALSRVNALGLSGVVLNAH